MIRRAKNLAARRQYAISGIIGIIFIGVQVYQLAARFLAPISSQIGTHVDVSAVVSTLLNSGGNVFAIVSGYLAVLIGTHLVLLFFSTWAYRQATAAFVPAWLDRTGILVSVLLAVTLLASLWNRVAFPNSLVFSNSDLLLMQRASPVLLWGLSSAFLLMSTLALIHFVLRLTRKARLSIFTACAALMTWLLIPEGRPLRGTQVTKPDVIVIGVDSLRPDFLRENGFPDATITPAINRLIEQSVVFDDAITPLARTFVAYMSLLSGRYPTAHGARFNLYPRERFDRSGLISHHLQNSGYATYYATDESRFANIDETFGFDHALTPPAGVLDFVLGSVYDSVATNLLAVTGMTQWLAPHVYGNRAAHRTYMATQYSSRLDSLIDKFPDDKPVFLVSHFCLPHWPYIPESYIPDDLSLIDRALGTYHAQAPIAYLRALRTVDTQVMNLMQSLRDAGRLDNATIVLLSDHGEAFGMTHDQIKSEDVSGRLSSYQGYGHGNFTLDASQYRVVLALQQFRNGQPFWEPGRNDMPATLIDLAPTVLAASGVPFSSHEFDGESLLPMLRDPHRPKRRLRFVESGLTGATIDTKNIDERAVAMEFPDLYRLAPDLRLEIAPDKLDGLLQQKQRGVYADDYGLTTLPVVNDPLHEKSCWVLSDFRRRTMRCLNEPKNDTVARPLYEATCQHFSKDTNFLGRWCPDFTGLGEQSEMNPEKG